MGKKSRAKRWVSGFLSSLLTISLLMPGATPAEAVTELSQAEFDEIVSRYTISKDAVRYKDYPVSYTHLRAHET